jgi:hypothetical protein
MVDGKDGALYAIMGALALAVVGGGIYFFSNERAPAPTEAPALAAAPPATTPGLPMPPPLVHTPPPPPIATPAPPPVVQTPPRPAPAAPAPSGPSAAQLEQVRQLVADARRMITRADFAAADRALDQAERIDPRSADVQAARRDLQDVRRAEARRDRRIGGLVAEARAAIARRDYAAADRALDQAERIDGADRQVQEARGELDAARPRGRPRPDRAPLDRDRPDRR